MDNYDLKQVVGYVPTEIQSMLHRLDKYGDTLEHDLQRNYESLKQGYEAGEDDEESSEMEKRLESRRLELLSSNRFNSPNRAKELVYANLGKHAHIARPSKDASSARPIEDLFSYAIQTTGSEAEREAEQESFQDDFSPEPFGKDRISLEDEEERLREHASEDQTAADDINDESNQSLYDDSDKDEEEEVLEGELDVFRRKYTEQGAKGLSNEDVRKLLGTLHSSKKKIERLTNQLKDVNRKLGGIRRLETGALLNQFILENNYSDITLSSAPQAYDFVKWLAIMDSVLQSDVEAAHKESEFKLLASLLTNKYPKTTDQIIRGNFKDSLELLYKILKSMISGDGTDDDQLADVLRAYRTGYRSGLASVSESLVKSNARAAAQLRTYSVLAKDILTQMKSLTEANTRLVNDIDGKLSKLDSRLSILEIKKGNEPNSSLSNVSLPSITTSLAPSQITPSRSSSPMSSVSKNVSYVSTPPPYIPDPIPKTLEIRIEVWVWDGKFTIPAEKFNKLKHREGEIIRSLNSVKNNKEFGLLIDMLQLDDEDLGIVLTFRPDDVLDHLGDPGELNLDHASILRLQQNFFPAYPKIVTGDRTVRLRMEGQ